MFQNFSGVEKNLDKKGVSLFPSEIFRLTVPKKFVGERFGVSKNSGNENFQA